MRSVCEQNVGPALHGHHRCGRTFLTHRDHVESSDALIASMAYDAVLRHLAVIGEAVRVLPTETTIDIVDVPWTSIAGLRNVVVHEYFRVDPEVVVDIIDHELLPLAETLKKRLR